MYRELAMGREVANLACAVKYMPGLGRMGLGQRIAAFSLVVAGVQKCFMDRFFLGVGLRSIALLAWAGSGRD